MTAPKGTCESTALPVHYKFIDRHILGFISRVYNYEPLTHLKSVRANCYGKYISVRGTVVRVGNIKPLCTKMAFRCAACGEIQSFPLPDGKYNLPTKVICSLTNFTFHLLSEGTSVYRKPFPVSLIRAVAEQMALYLELKTTRVLFLNDFLV